MTSDELRDIVPGDVVHRDCIPTGCAPWRVNRVEDAERGRCVSTQSTRPGGGSPVLYEDDPALSQYHTAAMCPGEQRRAS